MYLDEFGSLLFSSAANLANHDDSLGLRVNHKALQAVHEVGAVERVAADAYACGLAEANRGGLENLHSRQINKAQKRAEQREPQRQSSRTASYVSVPERDTTPMRPGLCMYPGMMPILHAPGYYARAASVSTVVSAWAGCKPHTLMIPGQFGPMRRVLLCCNMARFTLTMSCCGMPSVMHTTRSSSASTASKMARAARAACQRSPHRRTAVRRTCERRGHVDDGCVRARRFLGFCDGVEDGQPWLVRLRERRRRVNEAVTPHPGACCRPSSASHRRPSWFRMRWPTQQSAPGALALAAAHCTCSEWNVPFLPVKPWQMTCAQPPRERRLARRSQPTSLCVLVDEYCRLAERARARGSSQLHTRGAAAR